MSADVEYEFLVGLVMFILALEVAARRVGLPAAVAFIVGGAALALIPALPTFTIAPALVMIIFLPPLLINGGYFTPSRELMA